MKETKLEDIQKIYTSGDYGEKRDLDRDAPWKTKKIIKVLDKLFEQNELENKISILDVGGGTGEILSETSKYLANNHNLTVDKFVIDLDPKLLEEQKNKNPDVKLALNEDIIKTSLKNKQIDITLLIDVLEHVTDPEKVLNELKRISNFVILKVPLQVNLTSKFLNFVTNGDYTQSSIEGSAHLHFYNSKTLKNQIEMNLGEIIYYNFTNTFKYNLNSPYYSSNMNTVWKLYCYAGSIVFSISPKLCSYLFTDFAMILVKCYD